MKRYQLYILAAAMRLFILPMSSSAQLISYESFAGMSIGNGLTGSGTNASGWTDTGWIGGTNSRFQTIDPTPDLTYQINGGAFIDGSNRAVQLTTNPEPVSGILLASRLIPAQNTTVYVSFFVRPVAIGTGSDSIDLRFLDGSSTLARIAFQPDQNATYLSAVLPLDGAGDGSGSGQPALYPSQTYLVVARLTRPTATSLSLETWINPPGVYPGGGTMRINKAVSNTALLRSIGLAIASTDTGGPTTTLIVDEIRVGYTWADVVVPGPLPALVPDVQISSAVKLNWQTQSGKNYQPQLSYDLSNWINFGSALTGDGMVHSVFDSSDQDAKKFYRIQVR